MTSRESLTQEHSELCDLEAKLALALKAVRRFKNETEVELGKLNQTEMKR